MKMKRKIAILAAVMLLTGCAGGKSLPESSSQQTTTSAADDNSSQSQTAASAGDSTESPSVEPEKTTEQAATSEFAATSESTEVTTQGLPVKVQFVEDYGAIGGHDEFNLNDDEMTVKVVFSTESTVTDFRVLSISMQDYDDSGNFTFAAEELFTLDELTSERPLEAGLQFIGTIPNNGISFVDPDGNTKYYAVDMSGRDGSLFLWEITVV
ncbi:MAG: hypothetical protein J6B57_03565 [Oscillospiraceae bacterium]|nr:hypothetical protein [Oscillospiraceae bacterium]